MHNDLGVSTGEVVSGMTNKEKTPFFVELDKKGAEWVIVAYLSEDATMIEVCEKKLDPHLTTGTLVSGADPGLILKENKLLGHETMPEIIREVRAEHLPALLAGASFLPRNMTIRQMGKKSNHSLNYDFGARAYAILYGMREQEAKRNIALYHRAYPGIPLWHAWIQKQLKDNDRTLMNCFDRAYRFLGAWDRDLFRRGYAFVPQSTVADIVHEGIISTWRDEDLDDIEPLMTQVHDSQMVQIWFDRARAGEAQHFAERIIRIGLDYMNPQLSYQGREFRIDTEVKIGANWGQYDPDEKSLYYNPGGMIEFDLSPDVDKTTAALTQAIERLLPYATAQAA